MVGQTFGSYIIIRELGAGGMGEVYLAQHRHIARRAAIKVLRPEMSVRTGIVERFFNEARAASLIDHPNIVQVLDCDILPTGRAFMVMELLEGENLAQYLKRCGALPKHPRLVAALIGQIASGVAAAHEQGIIHRDLKPDNVFLVARGSNLTAKILDFGIAKLAAVAGSSLRTQTGNLLGTPVYMSPEQCRGSGAVDSRTDVYSLGCIAFELLTGRPPFVLEGLGELLSAHLSESPPRLDTLVQDLPAELTDFVTSMLIKDPAARLRSMTAAVEWVETFLGRPWTQFGDVLATLPDFPPPESSAGHATAAVGSAGVPSPATLIAPVASTAETVSDEIIRDRERLPSSVDPVLGATKVMVAENTTLSRSASEASGDRPGASRNRRAVLVVAAAVAVVAGVSFTLKRPEGARPTPSTAAAAPSGSALRAAAAQTAPVAPTALAPPQAVMLRIASQPASDVWLDGEAASRCRTPCRLSLPRADRDATVVLKAPGFADHVARASTMTDTVLDVQLQPVPEVGRPAVAKVPASGARKDGASARRQNQPSPPPEGAVSKPKPKKLPHAIVDL